MGCVNTINVGQTAELLGRIVGIDGAPIVQADIASISYSAYILQIATGEEEELILFSDVAIPVIGHLEDTLQLNSKWDTDSQGYNFHFVPSPLIFEERGERYLIRVTFVPADVDLPTLVGVWYVDVI